MTRRISSRYGSLAKQDAKRSLNPARRSWMFHALTGLAILLSTPSLGLAQRLTDDANGVLTAVVDFGTMTPGLSNTPSSQQVQFRLRLRNPAGYLVQARATFATTPSAADDGGAQIGASDIGIGITSIDTSASGVIKPRVDTIASGFDYDPAAVAATNGLTPYGGMASGQATINDLLNNPNMTILSGPQIANDENVNGTNNFLTVTMTVALLRQYFTPGSVRAVITLRMRRQ